MTTNPPIIDEAEGLVRDLAAELTRVRERECLCCYVARQLDQYPCDGTHRHSVRFRDQTAPRVTALHARLRRLGACCCDCEVLMNAYEPHPRLWTKQEWDDEGVAVGDEPGWPEPLPPCAGVRRGSLQPCTNWVQVRHW